MKRPSVHRLHLASLAASTALTAAALFTVAPVLRAQTPDATPAASSTSTTDIFDAIKKGADKLQKQAKDASKIEPQLKALQDRQAEYIKHQEEVERQLASLLMSQQAQIQRLTKAVEALTAEIKAAHHGPLPVPPAPPVPPAAPDAPAGPAKPLPATEPPAPPTPPAP